MNRHRSSWDKIQRRVGRLIRHRGGCFGGDQGLPGKERGEPMRERSHTPGPWEVNGNGVHKRISNHYATCIAVCEGQDRYANAKLIAAAPDLLLACEAVEIWMLSGQPGPYSDQMVLEMVGDAIRKAKANKVKP